MDPMNLFYLFSLIRTSSFYLVVWFGAFEQWNKKEKLVHITPARKFKSFLGRFLKKWNQKTLIESWLSFALLRFF